MSQSPSRNQPDAGGPGGRGGRTPAGGPTLMKRAAAPAMVTCWLLGLFWVVLYYMFQDDLPLVGDLGGWNLVIGMSFIAVGFVFATQWE